MKQRLDQRLVGLGLVPTRSQAENYIKLGQVTVGGRAISKPGFLVADEDVIRLAAAEQYVSRAALKLASVAEALHINFTGKAVLDVGSSTGGFTEYALRHGATKVIAVDVGSDQLHPTLRNDLRIELHERTDIRDFRTTQPVDLVLADVSFISLREILPSVAKLCNMNTELVIMVKPQFEAGASQLKHKGVIKNDRMRRDILKDFEQWAQQHFRILDKADSQVSGRHGNVERFYLLKVLAS